MAAAAGTVQQQQPAAADLASLWGTAQVRAEVAGHGLAPAGQHARAAPMYAGAANNRACLALKLPWRMGVSWRDLNLSHAPLQGDRNDPFGSYLAGLRLGTGF